MNSYQILLLEIMKFLIGLAYSIDNYEMANVFKMLHNLSKNMNYTVA